MNGVLACAMVSLVVVTTKLPAQESGIPPMPPLSERIAVAAGMGVSYIAAGDLVDLVNATPAAEEVVPAWRTGIQFFGSLTLPMFPRWDVKADYAYLLASYSVASGYGAGGTVDYTMTAHLPTVVVQYIVVDRPEYAVRFGAGVGYHFGELTMTFFGQDQRYTATGLGALLEVEGMTAVGEHLFAVLSVNARWEWIGALTDSYGREPANLPGSTTLRMVVPSVRIGVAYVM